MENEYYVYQLIDPTTNLPFYVGKGKGDRYRHHVYNRNKLPNSPISQTIKHILNEGHDTIPHIIVQQNMTESQAFDLEKREILQHGRIDLGTGTLVNRTAGGEGWGHERKWSKQTHLKRAKQVKNNPRGRPVCQYDIEGELVATFTSGSAAARVLKFPPGTQARINKACKQRQGSVAGFQWRYQDDSGPEPYVNALAKSVRQLTKDGTVVGTYSSIAQATEMTGINSGDIATMCRGSTRYKLVGGFIWKYNL